MSLLNNKLILSSMYLVYLGTSSYIMPEFAFKLFTNLLFPSLFTGKGIDVLTITQKIGEYE